MPPTAASAELHEAIAERDPQNSNRQRDRMNGLTRLGNLLLSMGRHGGSLEAYRKALEVIEALAGTDPRNLQWQRDIAVILGQIGAVLAEQRSVPEALEHYSRSLSISRRTSRGQPGQCPVAARCRRSAEQGRRSDDRRGSHGRSARTPIGTVFRSQRGWLPSIRKSRNGSATSPSAWSRSAMPRLRPTATRRAATTSGAVSFANGWRPTIRQPAGAARRVDDLRSDRQHPGDDERYEDALDFYRKSFAIRQTIALPIQPTHGPSVIWRSATTLIGATLVTLKRMDDARPSSGPDLR